VDIAPYGDEEADLVRDVKTIASELRQYSEQTGGKLDQLDRWLVINKTDTVLDEDQQEIVDTLLGSLKWSGPIYKISAIGRQGTQELCNDIMQYLESQRKAAQPAELLSIPEDHNSAEHE
jgi:GTP-binding protein